MFKIIITLLLSFAISTSYAMTGGSAYSIYKQIIQANGMKKYPTLVIVKSKVNNAYSGGGKIVVFSGLLRAVANSDELALVLGHELGHYTLGHMMSSPAHEYAADKLGAQYMSRAGYNICRGAYYHAKRHNKDSATHPASYKRYKALGC